MIINLFNFISSIFKDLQSHFLICLIAGIVLAIIVMVYHYIDNKRETNPMDAYMKRDFYVVVIFSIIITLIIIYTANILTIIPCFILLYLFFILRAKWENREITKVERYNNKC